MISSGMAGLSICVFDMFYENMLIKGISHRNVTEKGIISLTFTSVEILDAQEIFVWNITCHLLKIVSNFCNFSFILSFTKNKNLKKKIIRTIIEHLKSNFLEKVNLHALHYLNSFSSPFNFHINYLYYFIGSYPFLSIHQVNFLLSLPFLILCYRSKATFEICK